MARTCGPALAAGSSRTRLPTRWGVPARQRLFEFGPAFIPPRLDHRVIALRRAHDRLLHAHAEGTHQPTPMGTVGRDTEHAVDQGGHAVPGPDRTNAAKRCGPVGQPSLEVDPLV